ncbi:MAG: hypothetical protein ACP5D7_09500 [Limnospira sp.]
MSKFQTQFWLALSLTFAAIYGLLSLKQAFAAPNLVHDDARQHIFWMLRFVDRDLFPDDLIADYFQSVAPWGYTSVYRLGAIAGINPFTFAKIIPPILGLFCAYYSFGLCVEILPIPAAGFVGSLVTNQAIWMKDDLASGTPRAFIYPIFWAFLYYLVRRSLVGVGVTVAAVGLFYPQYVFVALGILTLRLVKFENGKFTRSHNNRNYYLWGIGLIVAVMVLLPYAIATSEFGPTMSKAEALGSPEFFPNGRSLFFHDNFIDIWFTGRRSGMFPKSLFTPATQCAGLLLPVLLLFPAKFPAIAKLKSGIWVLLQLLVSSVFMFFVAHAFLFKLHLPSRYTGLSFRIIIAVSTAIALTAILDRLLGILRSDRFQWKKWLSGSAMSLILILLLFYPAFVPYFPLIKYRQGRMTEIYEFFQNQPKDIVIASLSGEANQLPTFARRSVLMAREYAIPYQIGYADQMQRRTLDLIRAHYTQNPRELRDFIRKYDVDFWLIEPDAFGAKFIENNDWIFIFPEGEGVYKFLQKQPETALAKEGDRCTVFQSPSWIIVDANCILKSDGESIP